MIFQPSREFPRTKLGRAVAELMERYHRGEIRIEDFPEEFMKLDRHFPGIGFNVEAARIEQERLQRKEENKDEPQLDSE